jgi:DNA topoisomerase I
MDFIIVESPTKAKTLARFLGKEYEVEATMGHIKDLPKSKLGVDTERSFVPDYQVVEKRLDQIKKIQRIGKKAKKIYIATDPDREGEAIAQHVSEVLSDKNTKIPSERMERIVFHEITQSAVEEAIAHPRKVDRDLVDAQIARRVLDRLVGYKLSPLLWKKVRRGLSAGRVQSVAVRLIVEREREIEKFKPIEYWEIWSTVETNDKTRFDVHLVKVDDKKAEVPNGDSAKKIVSDLEGAKYVVHQVKGREVRKNPFPPFTTSTMSQAGARVFGWSSKRTMSLAQGLYEKGLITYHRTDSTNIAQIALVKSREYIAKEFGKEYLPEKAKVYKTKAKVAQEAHEAIRPTDLSTKFGSSNLNLEAAEQKLYDLIWRRFMASQMNQSIYDETTIDVAANKYILRASGQVMKFDGWRKVMPSKLSDEEVALPKLTANDPLDLVKVNSEQKFTQPPARFNEASLIKTLEKLGIGRPSTYAPTISTIQARAYVEKKDRAFWATTVGTAVNEFLVKNFPEVVDYSFTAQMEDNLDKVAEGKLKWEKEISDFYSPFEKKLGIVEEKAERVKIEVEKLDRPCPECKEGELVIRTGRFGKFISCARFPECKYTEKIVLKIDMKCPKCDEGEVVTKKTKKGRVFFGCSRYPDCDYASWKNPKLAEIKETVEEVENSL